MKNILIADGDSDLATLLTQYLHSEGFTVTIASDGELAIKMALNQSFDAIIMDVQLSKKNGFEVLKSIRQHSDIPVLIFTAETDPIDCIVGLEIGADDYVTKPCNPRELIIRLKAILRRAQRAPASRPVINYDHLTVNANQRKAFISNSELELTNAEFNILEILIKSPGQAFSKEELTEYALGRKYTAYDRSIDVHISNLRNKLGENASGEPWLKTVRGFGYMFNK